MNNFKKLILFSFIVVFFVSCQSAKEKKNEISFYGSDQCDHCVNFKKKLDSVGISYDFKDVEQNKTFDDEMMTKVKQAGITGTFYYPVLEINGKVLVRPSLEEVQALHARQQ